MREFKTVVLAVAVAVVLVSCIAVVADEAEAETYTYTSPYDGYEYSYEVTDNVITGYTEGIVYLYIPSSITSVGTVFQGCTTLECVVFEDGSSMTALTAYAFQNCTSLTTVYFGEDSSLTTINSYVFYGCTSLETVTLTSETEGNTLPSNVSTINTYAFYKCESLTSITIPSKVTKLYSYAFEYSGLTSVTLPSSITGFATTTKNYVFAYCTSLETVDFSEASSSLTTTGAYTFYGCTSLKTFILSSYIKTVGDYSFYGCTSLETLALSDGTALGNVTTLGSYALRSCSSLTFDVSETSLTTLNQYSLSGTGLTSVTLPSTVTTFGNGVFSSCASLEEADLSNLGSKITTTGTYAFQYCESLTSVALSSYIKTIGNYAFRGCTSLESVDLSGTSATSLGTNVFYGCESLTSVTLPDSLTTISGNAFYGCTSLISLSAPNVTSIGTYVFRDCTSLITVNLDSLSSVSNSVFYGCTSLASVSLSSTVSSIGSYAFYNCASLESLDLSESSITSVSTYAFYGCESLASVSLPSTVSSIGNYAFYGCLSLTSASCASSSVTIGTYAFYGCESLATLDIEHATTIGTYAFYGCESLAGDIKFSDVTSIAVYAFAGYDSSVLNSITIADGCSVYYTSFSDWSVVVSDLVFYSYDYTATDADGNETTVTYSIVYRDGVLYGGTEGLLYLYVPSAVTSIADYAFQNYTALVTVEFEEGSALTSIGSYAFDGCESLLAFEMPSTVTTLGTYAFQDCSSLETFTTDAEFEISTSAFNSCSSLESFYAPNATSVEARAFYNCSSLKTVTLTAVTSIGTNSFYNCSSMVSFVGPAVTSIGNYSFSYCESLTEVDLPIVTSIGSYAFRSCYSLTEVDLRIVTSIGTYAFRNCTSLESVYAPLVTSIGTYTFYGCSSLESVYAPLVTSIGTYAFHSCESLTELELGAVTSIGNYAFYGCESLTELELGAVTSIGNYAFTYCTSLESVVISSTGTVSLGNYSFGYDTALSYVSVEASTATIGTGAFYGCFQDSSAESCTLVLDGVTTIASLAFAECTYLAEVTLPSTVTSVSTDAFSGSTGLTAIYVDSGNTTYSSENGLLLSYDGTELILVPSGSKTVSLPANVETIGDDAFAYATVLKAIYVEDGNEVYASVGGILAVVGEDSYTLSVVPIGMTDADIECEYDLVIDDSIFEGTGVQYLTIVCNTIAVSASAFSGQAFEEVSITCLGGMAVVFDIESSSVSLYAYGDMDVSGAVVGAESFVMISYGDICVADGLLSGSSSTLEYLAVVADGTLTGEGTLLEEGGMASGGTVLLGWDGVADAAVAAIDGVSYWLEDGCDADGVSPCAYFVLADEFQLALQVEVSDDAGELSATVYVVTGLDVTGYSVASVESDGTSYSVFMVQTSDNHQVWDLTVEVYSDGAWTALLADDTEQGYDLSALGDAVVLRISEAEASSSDTYVVVSFDTGYSATLSSVRVVSGRSVLVSQLPTPSRTGYSFEGWLIYLDGEFVAYEQQKIEADTTLYAQWSGGDDCVELTPVGGYFYDAEGDATEGGEYDGGSVTYYFHAYTGFTFCGFVIESTGYVDYITGTTSDGVPYITLTGGEGYITITVTVKYASSSSDLTSVTDLLSASDVDELSVLWSFSTGSDVGTPLIVDGYVYVYSDSVVYKIDSSDGTVVAQADSSEASSSTFYYYLGYGDAGYILDYVSGNVLDTDLAAVTNSDGVAVTLPSGMIYAVWYEGYFYAVYDGALWKFTPEQTDEGGVVVNLLADDEGNAFEALDIYSQWGYTASVTIVDGCMYWISAGSSGEVYLCAADLETGETAYTELQSLSGYYLDDGWLTYYGGYVYVTGYSQTLMSSSGKSPSAIVWLSVDGLEFGDENVTYCATSDGTYLYKYASALVIQNGRGYVYVTESRTTGYLLVYDVGDDGSLTLASSVAGPAAHGGIVVSTAGLTGSGDSLSGTAYIYVLSYSTPATLYIYSDTCADGVWTMSAEAASYEIDSYHCTQAIRVDSEGRIVFYTDSGYLYCFTAGDAAEAASEDLYYFLIEDGDSYSVVSGSWSSRDVYSAIVEAFEDATGYDAVYDEDAGTLTYADVVLYAYYYDGDSLVPLTECDDTSSVRSIILLLEGDSGEVDLTASVYTSSSTAAGSSSDAVPITVDGEAVTEAEMAVGETLSLTSVDGAVWGVSDSSVVTVDQDGNVTAVAMGTTLVYAAYTDDDGITYYSTVAVHVTEASLGDVVSDLEYYAYMGMTKSVYSLVEYVAVGSDGETTVVWTTAAADGSSVSLLVPCDYEYELLGWYDGESILDPGSAYTVAGDSALVAYWYSTEVSVTDADGNEVDAVELLVGDTSALTAATSPEYTTGGVVWSSSDESVATVDEDGNVTAVGIGTATIIATAADGSGAYATVEVTVRCVYTVTIVTEGDGTVDVTAVEVRSGTTVSVSDGTLTIVDADGETVTVTATASDATAQYTYYFASWSVSDGDEVDGDVTVTATFATSVNYYTVTVAAGEHGSASGSAYVPYGTAIAVDGDGVLWVGEYSFTASADDGDGDVCYYAVSWEYGSDSVSGDVTATAVFTAVGHSYVYSDGSYVCSVCGHTVAVEDGTIVVEAEDGSTEAMVSEGLLDSGSDVAVVFDDATVTLDADAAAGLSGTSVTISATDVTDSVSGDVYGEYTYELTATDSDGNAVTEFSGTVTVEISVTVPDGYYATVYYVDGSTLVEMPTTSTAQSVTFETTHFSEFTVYLYEESDDVLFSVIVVVVGVLEAVLIAYFGFARKGKAPEAAQE